MDAMTTAPSQPLPVPAAPGRLVSMAAARRIRRDHESSLRLRRISALGPNAALHRGRASVHTQVLDGIGDAPLSWGHCRHLAEELLREARSLQASTTAAPPARALTPTEIFDAARLEELILSALRLSAGAAAHPGPDHAARVRLLLHEGMADTGALLAEAWDDALWG
jgi:hypothetical protein